MFYDEESSGVKTPGQIYKLPKLAETLRIIAKEGVDAIYNGSLTSLVLEDLKKVKSIITKEHLANYEWVAYLVHWFLWFLIYCIKARNLVYKML